MQQLLVAPKSVIKTTGALQQHKQHVYHDTELHPYQRQPHRRVHHDQAAVPAADTHGHELVSAVELSYQYTSNIVNYRTDAESQPYSEEPQQQQQQLQQDALPLAYGRPTTPLPRPPVYRARVDDYSHPSMLARDIVAALYPGSKLLLELPDEPAAVSCLLTALGRAAGKLKSIGLATALDPVYDPAAVVHGCSTMRASGPAAAASSSTPHHHTSGSSGSGGICPSSSQDTALHGGASSAATAAGGGGGHRRPADGCYFVLCARAVPIPPAATAATPMAYTVGSSMGQEVLRVGPSCGVHSLLPALLQAILRDGLVTLRCCWFDEEIDSDPWSDDEADAVAFGTVPVPTVHIQGDGSQAPLAPHQFAAEGNGAVALSGCPAGVPAAGPPGSPFSPLSSLDQQHAHPAGSLVKVPCVLRAVFKLDRQLRGLDLGGIVLLPHTFLRPGAGRNTQVVHLDVVIA